MRSSFSLFFFFFDGRGRRIFQMNFIDTVFVTWEMGDWYQIPCKLRSLHDISRDSLYQSPLEICFFYIIAVKLYYTYCLMLPCKRPWQYHWIIMVHWGKVVSRYSKVFEKFTLSRDQSITINNWCPIQNINSPMCAMLMALGASL
jgi:hypothetical protein